ncbi:MAG TPA: hypothetical protein VKA89_01865 [Solirubrobacterales bacterium]|nr:hypothetical protein [Solirubrobacterales bacterium]
MRRGARGAVALAAFALGVAGCGSDEDENDPIATYCDKIAALQAEPDPTAGLREGDLAGAKQALAKFEVKIGEVAKVAPPQIRGDVRRLQRVYRGFNADVQGIMQPNDALGLVGRLQSAGQEIQEITRRLTAFTAANCGEGSGG